MNETIELHNEFHGTSVTIRPNRGGYISRSTYYRARKALCGIKGCTCLSTSASGSGKGVLPLVGAVPVFTAGKIWAYHLVSD